MYIRCPIKKWNKNRIKQKQNKLRKLKSNRNKENDIV